MRRSFAAAALSLAVVMISALAGAPGFAQPALTLPGGGLKPPPLPPIKPYQTIAVKPPAPFDDPAFVAFRKQLAAIAANKDRAGLGHLIVEQNFFWIQDHDLADKHKAGIDNLAKAINLDAKDGSGWDVVAGYANEPTAAAVPQQKGVVCAPADPIIDADAFAALGKSTGTEPSEWGYPTNGGIDVHAASQPSSPVIEKLGMVLIRVLPDSTQPTNPDEPFLLHIATPSGKSGYVDAQQLSPLGGDEMCYIKDANGWKIAGYLGGVSQ
ncbi:MAG: hypothetical protein WCA56_09440 [Xanthobacteraceae bacterium]|jgi:hypothetical protein